MSKRGVQPNGRGITSANGRSHPTIHYEEEIEYVPSEPEAVAPDGSGSRPVEEQARQVQEQPAGATVKERNISALAHAALLLNRTGGITGTLIALVIWLVWREHSPYIRRQAAQAVVWQLALAAIQAVLAGGWNFLLIVNTYWGIFNPLFLELIGPLITYIALLLYLIWSAVALLAAIMTYQGRPWRYPLTGGIELAAR